jgi:hypothetical protein
MESEHVCQCCHFSFPSLSMIFFLRIGKKVCRIDVTQQHFMFYIIYLIKFAKKGYEVPFFSLS